MHTGHPLIVGKLHLSREVVQVTNQAAENYTIAWCDIGAHSVEDMLGEVWVETGMSIGSHFFFCKCAGNNVYKHSNRMTRMGETVVEGSGCEADTGCYIPRGSNRTREPKEASVIHFLGTSFAGRVSDNPRSQGTGKKIKDKAMHKEDNYEEFRADSNTGDKRQCLPRMAVMSLGLDNG